MYVCIVGATCEGLALAKTLPRSTYVVLDWDYRRIVRARSIGIEVEHVPPSLIPRLFASLGCDTVIVTEDFSELRKEILDYISSHDIVAVFTTRFNSYEEHLASSREWRGTAVPDARICPGLSSILLGRALAIHDTLERVETIYRIAPISGFDSMVLEIVRNRQSVCIGIDSGTVIQIPFLAPVESVGRGRRVFSGSTPLTKYMTSRIKRFSTVLESYPAALVYATSFLGDVDHVDALMSRDVVELEVVVEGTISSRRRGLAYRVRYGRSDMSSICSLVALTALSIAKAIAFQGIRGFVPPEVLGLDERLFCEVLSYLQLHGLDLEVCSLGEELYLGM